MSAMLIPMPLTARMLLIVLVGVFLASFVDGVAGGGGIISVPTYFLAGLPAHLALGTNKLSSGIGTVVSTLRFIRGGFVNWRLAIPSVALALYGSHLGTRLQLALDDYQTGTITIAYTPVTYLGSQVVAGTNHAILCRASEINKGSKWVIIYIYEDLEGNASVIDVADFDFGALCTY